MCLYPRFIKNKKYLMVDIQGKTKELKDIRAKYVPVGCGNCIECRKQKANAWRIRLCEEIKIHKYAYFITLTFNNENLKKLCCECECKESNAVATIAVRRFLERWRKKYGHSLKHWLITELGHTGTERIHLHGIIFNETPITNEQLQEVWKYGLSDTGKYCNIQTINYIVKYVTKIDNDHKGYKAIILSSAGLGANYLTDTIKQIHRYRGKETKDYYTLNNGQKIAQPIYYRNKLYTPDQREELWLQRLDQHTRWVKGIKIRNIDTPNGWETLTRTLKKQQEINESLGYGNAGEEWKEKDYNITVKMLNNKPK